MTCEVGCKTIESKLAGTDGVSEAKVDFETKSPQWNSTKQNKASNH